MATFEKRLGRTGKVAWRVRVRRSSGPWLTRSFATRKDAETSPVRSTLARRRRARAIVRGAQAHTRSRDRPLLHRHAAESKHRKNAAEQTRILTWWKTRLAVVAESAVASARRIEAAFSSAPKNAATVVEGELLSVALQKAADQGRGSAEGAARAKIELRDEVERLANAADPLADSFSRPGVTAQRELDRIAATARAYFEVIMSGAATGAPQCSTLPPPSSRWLAGRWMHRRTPASSSGRRSRRH
jgi:hypothetical protein